MLNQLLKFTLVSSLLIWLRPRWRGLLALSFTVVLVHVLHGEYLGYVALSGERSLLLWSYFIKWAALVAAVLAYLFFTLFGSRQRPPGTPRAREAREPQGKPASENDGFDFLRQKKQLQNRAEMIISRKAGDDNSR